MNGPAEIVLGPNVELHTGIHSSFVDFPVTGVSYTSRPHGHVFELCRDDNAPFSPFERGCLAQLVRYDLALATRVLGVHSSRLPVYNQVPWLVDADCLLATIQFGTPLVAGSATLEAAKVSLPVDRRRVARMTELFCSENCVGILLRSEHARHAAVSFIADSLGPRAGETFSEKSGVLYPTLPALQPEATDGKRVRVVFSGRSIATKGAEVAKAVYRELSHERGLSLVWVGEHALEDMQALPHVEFHGTLPRKRYLDLLRTADVLFTPTPYESYGMALVEAICMGLAIVASRGRGMEHVEEIIGEGPGAILVDNDLSTGERTFAYCVALRSMVGSPETLRRMRWENHRCATTGPLAIGARNRVLEGRYDAMREWHRRADRGIRNRTDLRTVEFGDAEISASLWQLTEGRHVRWLVESRPA